MKNLFFFIAIALSIALAFTPFYSIGYLIATVATSPLIARFTLFKTHFSQFILTIAVLLAIIPLMSLLTWLLDIENHALYNLLGFYGFMGILYEKPKKKQLKRYLFINRLDIVAVISATLPVIVIIGSFFALAPNKDAALFQLAAEGWDNGSHISMIQDVNKKNGYVYGPWSELKNTMIQKFQAYPQAWHLTSGHFINGFGGERFAPDRPLQTLAFYMLVCALWMILTIYALILSTGHIWKRLFPRESLGWKPLLSIAIISVGLQSISVYASFAHGFPNFIATILYIILVSTLLFGMQKKSNERVYILITLFGVMAVLTWFLVLPAVALMIFLALIFRKETIRESIISLMKDWRLLLILIGSLTAMTLQVLIFQKYAEVTGESQLNEGARINPYISTVGVFVINQILLGIVLAVSFVFALSKSVTHEMRKYILAVLVPWVIMAFGLYFYQNITAGYTSYYTSKIFAITVLLGGLIFTIAILVWLQKRLPRISTTQTVGLTLLITCLLIIGTGQSLTGVNKLFANNARTPYAIAEEIVTLLPEAVKNKTKIVVLTEQINNDDSRVDRHGMLEQRLLHQKLGCAYSATRTAGLDIQPEEALNVILSKLATCADKLERSNQTITAIVSEKTYDKVKALNRSNIKLVLVSSKSL